MDYKEKTKLFKVRKTLLEMLEDRNYTIPDDILNLTPNDYRYMYNNNKYNFNVSDGNKTCYIMFFLNSSGNVKINSVREYINNLDKKDNDEFLIILKNINTSLKKLEKEFNCNLFEYKRLQVNITKHSYVPKHELIKKEKEKEILNLYNITNKLNLPCILVTDAVCKYYNFKSGRILKITRNSRTSGKTIGYRYIK